METRVIVKEHSAGRRQAHECESDVGLAPGEPAGGSPVPADAKRDKEQCSTKRVAVTV